MIYFIIFLLIPCSFLIITWKFSTKNLRLPLIVYLGSYIFTTVIGATWLGLSQEDGTAWKLLESYGISTELIKNQFNFNYWLLLYAPIFIPVTLAVLTTHFFNFTAIKLPSLNSLSQTNHKTMMLFITTVLIFTLYCLFLLYHHHFLSGLVNLNTIDANPYQAEIKLRSNMMHTLGTFFYSILYMILPTLSQFALYNWLTQKSRTWLLLLGFTVAITCTLILLTLQKAPIVVYFAFLMLGTYCLRPIKPRAFLIAGLALFSFVTLYQCFFIQEWQLLDSLKLFVFRMASAFPFYNAIFTTWLPYSGIDVATDMIRLAPSPANNLLVFSYMYPDIQWVAGSATAPAHVVGYSEGGILYALVILCLTGCLIGGITKLREKITNGVFFALYIQSLVSLYYLTQTSLRNVLISSFGFIWVIFGLGTLVMLAFFLKKIGSPPKLLI